MSCWRLLPLAESPDSSQIPQLLVKPDFRSTSYTVFVTDLSNIWSEELEWEEIVVRASERDSPIEVSEEDTSQLPILVDHIKQSLTSKGDSVCQVTKGEQNGIVLHTTSSLPKPLGSLKWKFQLRKRTSAILKNELILPLLVSSHIQHERINGLLATIRDKDRAITRFVDQFESSNLDLALAFPSIAGMKTGRRQVTREQAARHIPALQPFQEEDWKRETSQLDDDHVSTLGLFQEALSECRPKVPAEMKSADVDGAWWASIRSAVKDLKKTTPKRQNRTSPAPKSPPKVGAEDETETDDDFEISEDLQRRLNDKARSKTQERSPFSRSKILREEDRHSQTESDDDDLDAPSKSQSQRQSQSQKGSSEKRSPSPKSATASHSPKKRAGFRIGGTKGKETKNQDRDEETPQVSMPTRAKETPAESPPKPRKKFTIGGKGKAASQHDDTTSSNGTSPKASRSRGETTAEQPPVEEGDRGVSLPGGRTERHDETAREEEHEETAEEKAERRRGELKRRNMELARQQAHKKKKRF